MRIAEFKKASSFNPQAKVSSQMLERLTSADSIENACQRIRELIDAHGEWLYVQTPQSRAVPVNRNECDFRVSHGQLIFSFCDDRGAKVWRITAWEWTGGKLLLEASRRMGAERARLELILRASLREITETVAEARRRTSERLAQLACNIAHGLKVERAGLSVSARRGQPGRYARILLSHLARERIGVTADLAARDASRIDAFLSQALIWFARLQEGARRPPVQKLWLIALKECVMPLTERLALLRDELRRAITLYEVDGEQTALAPVRLPELEELWKTETVRFRPPSRARISESAAAIVALAPEAIDVVRSRHGETLRFHGLPFARVRRLMGVEKVWFGLESKRRRPLDDRTREDWLKLLRDLMEHRRAEPADQHHALYTALPEAWLESLLRRDLTRLDPGLKLAPLYTQFRPSHAKASRPIDLLALRRDGRLVVIELKVSEDREHVLQGADYWRRVEAHRRAGHIRRARLFEDAEISDEPPLVYLVAPALRFHRAFQTLSHAITPAIEMYRFDLNENWRARVRVTRRMTSTIN